MSSVFCVALPRMATQGVRLFATPAGGFQRGCVRSRECGEGRPHLQPPSHGRDTDCFPSTPLGQSGPCASGDAGEWGTSSRLLETMSLWKDVRCLCHRGSHVRESRTSQRHADADPTGRGEEGRRELQRKRPAKSVTAGLLRPKDSTSRRQLCGAAGSVCSRCEMTRFSSFPSAPFFFISYYTERRPRWCRGLHHSNPTLLLTGYVTLGWRQSLQASVSLPVK